MQLMAEKATIVPSVHLWLQQQLGQQRTRPQNNLMQMMTKPTSISTMLATCPPSLPLLD